MAKGCRVSFLGGALQLIAVIDAQLCEYTKSP